jgi:hypothetical protein
LTINGDKAELAKCLKAIARTEDDFKLDESDDERFTTNMDFEKIVPRPKEKEADLYNWNVANWGTKWNARDAEYHLNAGGSEQCIGFSTAWSPPVGVFEKLVKKFPKLNFKLEFWEGGMGFAGHVSGSKGKIGKVVTMKYAGNRGG